MGALLGGQRVDLAAGAELTDVRRYLTEQSITAAHDRVPVEERRIEAQR